MPNSVMGFIVRSVRLHSKHLISGDSSFLLFLFGVIGSSSISSIGSSGSGISNLTFFLSSSDSGVKGLLQSLHFNFLNSEWVYASLNFMGFRQVQQWLPPPFCNLDLLT